jgi:hypothetical protein
LRICFVAGDEHERLTIPNTLRTHLKRSEEGFALYMTAFSLLFFWTAVFFTPQPVISSTYQIIVNFDQAQSVVQPKTSTPIEVPFPWEPDGSALSPTSSAHKRQDKENSL